MPHKPRWRSAIVCSIALLFNATPSAHAVILDSWIESFDNRESGIKVTEVESWTVTSGSEDLATIETSVTPSGTGKALVLTGNEDPLTVARTAVYGGQTPTWVRFMIRPGVGGEERLPPTTGIAAVSFDYTGKVLANDGVSWTDTGVSYEPQTWWEVIYKLNFNTHTYDLYLIPEDSADDFSPVKTGLRFVDPSRNSLEVFEIGGAFSKVQEDETYIDEITVTYIDKLEFVTGGQTITQGESSSLITVQLQNSVGEAQKAIFDTFLDLKTSSSNGEFSLSEDTWSPITQILIPKDATSVSFFYRDSTLGKPTITVRASEEQGWTEAIQQQNIVYFDPHFEVLATSPQVAGQPFPISIYAKNEQGEIDTEYTGTVGLSVTYIDPTGSIHDITPSEGVGFSGGLLQTNVTYDDAGSIRINVMDLADTSRIGASGVVQVKPAGFSVVADSKQTVDMPFNLTVSAINAKGAPTPGYSGTVTLGLETVDPNASGTLSTTSVSLNGGPKTIETSFNAWGSIYINAEAADNTSLIGKSNILTFHPYQLKMEITAPPSPRDFFYIQEPIQVKLSAISFTGGTIPNYAGTVTFNSAAVLDLPDEMTFQNGQSLSLQAVGKLPGTYSLSARDIASGVSTENYLVHIKEAILKVISTVGAVGSSVEVPIYLVDEEGEIIDAESSTELSFLFDEENDNNSLNSSSYNYPIQLINGRATLLLTNTEAENITITPSFPFALKVESGTVRFGRYATKGVGVLLWRELRPEPLDE